jgi:hypothetical protein
MRWVDGDPLGEGAPFELGFEVLPGQEADISVVLTAPQDSGRYKGVWQLHNNDGMAFGTQPFVVIRVP